MRLRAKRLACLLASLAITATACDDGGSSPPDDMLSDATGGDTSTDATGGMDATRIDATETAEPDTAQPDTTDADSAEPDAEPDTADTADTIDVVEPTCSDQLQNQDETDVDCGGTCDPCANDAACAVDAWIDDLSAPGCSLVVL